MLRKTRVKNKSVRRRTHRIKGGKLACLEDTPFNKFVKYLWSQVQYILRNEFYDNYRFDQHRHGRFSSCNLWGWVPCHTSRSYDTHFDVYFINRNRIGIVLTYRNIKNHSRDLFFTHDFNIDFDDPDYYKNSWDVEFNDFVYEIADWIDYTYWEWMWNLERVTKRDC